jgi:hypothetical protein
MELATTFLEHASWPLVVFCGFLLFGASIRKMLSRVRGARAGSVEVQFEEELHHQGLTKDQLLAISSLTGEELGLFLLVSYSDSLGFNYNTALPPDVYKARVLRLRDAGLLHIHNPDNPGTDIRHNVTPAGNRFRALVITSTSRMLRQL